MVSILTVPTQRSEETGAVELRPEPTRQRLAKLPLLDSEQSLSDIFEALYELNRVEVRPATRLRLLELYRTPISFIAANVERTLSGKHIPFSDEHAGVSGLCKRVATEMAYGYKAVVLELARSMRSAKPSEDRCTAVHRSIRYLALVMYQYSISYTSYPPGTWSEIHSLYGYARKLGFQDVPVKDALNTTRPKNSISHAYNQALLFGLSDNYRNSINTIGKIFRYLDRWASVVEVLPYAKPPTTRCQFIIDPEVDKPGQAYSENLPAKKSKRLLLLDTRGITKTAHNQWQKLRSGISPKTAGLGDDFFDDSGFDMLERVVLAWGIAPRRKYPRNAVSGLYQVAVGIDTTHYFLNGGRSFRCASENADDQLHIVTSSTFGMERAAPEQEESYLVQDWRGSDESIHGIGLYTDITEGAAVQIRVGEVIGFRPNRDDALWSAGIVRWVRITDHALRAGVQKLGAGAAPVAIKPVKPMDASEASFSSCILLPEHEAVPQDRSLVTRRGMYRMQRNLLLDDGEILTMARAGELLERNSHYDWFAYEVLNI